jgi:hypothetical protein
VLATQAIFILKDYLIAREDLRKFCAVVKRFNEIEDVLHGGRLSQQCDSALVEGLRLLFDVFFFSEEEKVALLRNLFVLLQILRQKQSMR